MTRHLFVLASLLAGLGCQFLPSAATNAGLAAGGDALPLTPKGSAGESAGAPDASSLSTPDPLRDPRERRLRHVRQLTRSRLVAMPHFSADGRFLYVAEKRAADIVLLRVNAADLTQPTAEVAAPDSTRLLWGLTQGKGGPCAVESTRPCAGEAWPAPEALLSCEGLATAALPGDPPLACPAIRGSLPCATGASGNEVCPVRAGDSVHLVLSKGPDTSAASSPLPLGPATGNSWMPSLSRDGARLVFVTEPAMERSALGSGRGPGDTSRLEISFLDHPDPQPVTVGPEASRILDPTFNPAGDRVLFASSADDAAGQEIDLLLVSVIGGALERVTFAPGVDRYPTFSPDGKQLAWVSERNADTHAEDLFIADWVEP